MARQALSKMTSRGYLPKNVGLEGQGSICDNWYDDPFLVFLITPIALPESRLLGGIFWACFLPLPNL